MKKTYLTTYYYQGKRMWTSSRLSGWADEFIKQHIAEAMELGDVVFDATHDYNNRQRIIIRYEPSRDERGHIRAGHHLVVTEHFWNGHEWSAHNEIERENLAYAEMLKSKAESRK